jgi:hypothetical protein
MSERVEIPEATDRKERTRKEEFAVSGEKLLAEIKRLVNEGNVRRISIKQGEKTLIEVPLTLGVIGIALMPVWAAIGAIAALVTECTIVVEKVE